LPFSLRLAPPPGRPEGVHLQSPTAPSVTLASHTARAHPSLEGSPPQSDAARAVLLPVAWLASALLGLAPPLHSRLMTRSSSRLREHPPPPAASILSPCVGRTERGFSSHHPQSSHVPRQSPDQARATGTPGVAAAGSRFPRDCSWSRTETPLATPSGERFRRWRGFAQRSPAWSLPDSSRLPFPHRSLPCPCGAQPREGVCRRCRHIDSEGPALISRAPSGRNGSHVPYKSRKRSPIGSSYAAGSMSCSRSAGVGSKDGTGSPQRAASHAAVI
jgi:hypothetical protein